MRRTLDQAVDPLVIALDVGSTATRGEVYDATGWPVEPGRVKVPHAFTARGDGASEIDPDAVLREIEEILTGLATEGIAGRVAGVALDTFASSLVGVGADGRASTPCYTYADSRCAPQVSELRRSLDEPEVQQRTGCRLHTSYLAPRLRWIRETSPGVADSVERWMSLGEYVYLRLLGTTAAGTSTAAWTGLLDRRTGTWDRQLLEAAGVTSDQLSEVRDPDQPIRDVDDAVGRRWPALAGAAWFSPISDGFASSVGAGSADASSVVAAVATSGAMRVLVDGVPEVVPSGLWCYRVDAARSLLGGAVNDVGRAVAWLQSTVRLDPDVGLDDLLVAEPDPGTPVVLPFLTGERSTGWAGGARAVFAEVSAATTGPMLFRGAMEGVAITYARMADQLREVTGGNRRILGSGRVTQDLPGWLQVLADVLEAPVTQVTQKRATLRGTALIALEHLAPGVDRVPPATGQQWSPIPGRAPYYAARRDRFEALYEAALSPSS